MKGTYKVIAPNGKEFFYRYLSAAVSKYFNLWGTLESLEHFDTHVISY